MRFFELRHGEIELFRIKGGLNQPTSIQLVTGRDSNRLFARKQIAVLQQEAEQQINSLAPLDKQRGHREASDIFHTWFWRRLLTDGIINGLGGAAGITLLANHNLLFGALLLLASGINEASGLLRAGELKNAANTHWRRSQAPTLPQQE